LTRLPALSWKKVVKGLERAGFVFDRQKGSHMVYYHPESQATVTVPRHSTIKRGTMAHILKQAGVTHHEFLSLLNE
jgi:predicted RNA binding protein YcfA (HicA-like mRNA interferase family)